tara:strand:+ start:28404 stop:28955 length:552 start_codon:yes stop_codon:yes gene_type:complete
MNEKETVETTETEPEKFRLRTIISDADVVDLRKPSDPVSLTELNSSDTKELIQALKDYVVKHGGLGMAAVQLGVHKRIFVMRRPFSSDNLSVIVNPVIHRGTGHAVKGEGCFSLPNMPATPMVKRMSMIHVTYTDEHGVEQAQDMLVGMDARIFQHELDHLNGVLMIDAKSGGRGFQQWKRSF